MTANGRKFPLPFSSLENRSANRNNKSTSSVVKIETPQTATQNARQNAVQSAENDKKGKGKHAAAVPVASEKHLMSTNVIQPVASARGQVDRGQLSEHNPEPRKKKLSAQAILEGPRRAMVTRLVKQGIKDNVVLEAMGAVPRHQFVEPGLIGQAYVDASLPIGHHQTISQPYIVARMIEVMKNGRKLHNVLEIGTGCGYQAAVLAQLVENVYSIERIKLLHELAKKNLRSLRIANLRLHYGDGKHGLPQVDPFDGIILAAAGMQIPDALLQQLAIGGRLIAPVGETQQVLQLIERTGNAEWTKSVLEECYFVPLCSGII